MIRATSSPRVASDCYTARLADDLIPRLEQELSDPDLHGLGRGSRELAMVDLWGRLSNPPEAVKTLADQGRSIPWQPPRAMETTTELPGSDRRAGAREEKGRLSNPVQRRLSAAEIEQLIHRYRKAASIDGLARYYEVHRSTVIHHLDRAGVPRLGVVRKMTDESVALAAARYEQGASLALVASELGVHQRTLTREFRRAGATIRPRRGWRR